MGGFLNNEINNDYVTGMICIVIDRLLTCSQLMKDECNVAASKIDNNEEKIRNRLVEKYLNNDSINHSMNWTDIPLRYNIDLIQQTELKDYIVSNFSLGKKSDKTYLVYSSKYKLLGSHLKLNHLFFNFATAINLCQP